MIAPELWTLRGLFEAKSNSNMLSNLTNNLEGITCREFEHWQAGFGDYDRELDRVSGLLRQAIIRHEGPLMLAGYSGGSHIVKRALLGLKTEADRAKVVKTILVADPSQPDQFYNNDRVRGTVRTGAAGIAGSERLWMPDGVLYVVSAGDPIAFTPFGSPLGSLAALLTSLGPDVGVGGRLRVKLAAAAVGRRYDLFAYGEALSLLRDYSVGGAHQRPYPELLRRVAFDINQEAKQ